MWNTNSDNAGFLFSNLKGGSLWYASFGCKGGGQFRPHARGLFSSSSSSPGTRVCHPRDPNRTTSHRLLYTHLWLGSERGAPAVSKRQWVYMRRSADGKNRNRGRARTPTSSEMDVEEGKEGAREGPEEGREDEARRCYPNWQRGGGIPWCRLGVREWAWRRVEARTKVWYIAA